VNDAATGLESVVVGVVTTTLEDGTEQRQEFVANVIFTESSSGLFRIKIYDVWFAAAKVGHL
jgi:hypothetical protein